MGSSDLTHSSDFMVSVACAVGILASEGLNDL